MSAMPSAENALRDSLQALVDLGTGAWFAGREAHEHGPKALYDVLLAVTTHREIALQHGVLLETSLKTPPQHGQVFIYDGKRCRFWRTRDGRRWLIERHTKDPLVVPGVGRVLTCYYGAEDPKTADGPEYAGLARRAYSLHVKGGGKGDRGRITLIQYLRQADHQDARTPATPAPATPAPAKRALEIPTVGTPRPTYRIKTAAEVAEYPGSDEGESDGETSPLEAALLEAQIPLYSLQTLAAAAIEEFIRGAVWNLFG